MLYDYLRTDPNHINPNQKTTAKLTESAPKQSFNKDQFDIRSLEETNYLTQRNIAAQTLQRPKFTGTEDREGQCGDSDGAHVEPAAAPG